MKRHARTLLRPAALVSFTLAWSLGAATTASAVNINDCGDAIDVGTGNAVLTEDLEQYGGGSCLEVKDGKSLNLNGYSIICVSGYSCGVAVDCATSSGLHTGSLIYSGVAGDGSHADIKGDYTVGVQNCGTVKNLRIIEADTGILFTHSTTDGEDYLQNVIEPAAGGRGIDVKAKDSGDLISENLIIGGDIGIHLRDGRSVSQGALVTKNTVRSYASVGIKNTTNDYFRIERNTVIEGDDGSVPFDNVGASTTYNDNICEEDVDDGRCECEIDLLDMSTLTTCTSLL